MHEHVGLDDRRLDDQLAEFADCLLAKDTLEDGMDLSAEDQRLRVLQETVVLLRRAVKDIEPGEALAGRIRTNLLAQWHALGFAKKSTSTWERIREWLIPRRSSWRSAGGKQRAYALRLAVVTLLIVLGIVLIAPAVGSALPGTADGQAGLLPVFLALGFALVAALVWIVRRKR